MGEISGESCGKSRASLAGNSRSSLGGISVESMGESRSSLGGISVESRALPSTSDARPEVNDHLQRVVFDTPSNFPC